MGAALFGTCEPTGMGGLMTFEKQRKGSMQNYYIAVSLRMGKGGGDCGLIITHSNGGKRCERD